MLATIPRKPIACLGSILVALAATACGGAAEPAPDGPSADLEAISPIVSSLGESLEVVEDQVAVIKRASLESTYVGVGGGGTGVGPEGLMKVFTDGAAVLAQQGTTLEGLEGQIAQISSPKDARRYHELLAEYIDIKKEGVRELGRQLERQDILCCLTWALGDWEQRTDKAAVTKDEIAAEARRLGYPEVD